MPTPEPGRQIGQRLILRQVPNASSACFPDENLRQHGESANADDGSVGQAA
jgi:hypothetical protein